MIAQPDVLAGYTRTTTAPGRYRMLAELFHQLGNETRLGLMFALLDGEKCVCELARLSGVSVSAVSHQLRLLRSVGLVSGRRAGRHIFYSLADNHVEILISVGLQHINE